MAYLQVFDPNPKGKDFIVGDIHGCYAELMLALHAIGFDGSSDRLFCVGDLTDRGSDNTKAMTLIDEPWFHMVLGNHELMLMARFFHNQHGNGTNWAYNMLNGPDNEKFNLMTAYLEKLKKMPNAIELNTSKASFGIVHAGAYQASWFDTLEQAELDYASYARNNPDYVVEDDTTWSRDVAYNDGRKLMQDNPIDGIDFVVHGHTVQKAPLIFNNRLYIDTGFFYGHMEKTFGDISFVCCDEMVIKTVRVDFPTKTVLDVMTVDF